MEQSKIFDLIPESLHEQLLLEAQAILEEKKQNQPAPEKLTTQELDKIIGKL